MKDIYFDDYKNRPKRDSKYDTGKVPLTKSEREMHEQINRRRYEQAVRNQQNNNVRYIPPDEFEENFSEEEPRKPVRKKKKRGCGCSTIFLCFLLIVALICGGTFGYGYSMCSKTNYVKPDGTRESYGTSRPEIYNVLLIGADKESGGASRSDSMILVSVDSISKKLKFTSFMRDMWVEIPGYDDAKLNAAFAYGGPELLMTTIEKNFGVHIDNYVMVDFEMFQKLIDGIGGIDVEITQEEADFINRTSHAKVNSGVNHLDGDYALIYSRIRKLDSDFMRTQRQRKVMTAILNKAVSQNILLTLSAANDVLPLITTDISPLKMTTMGFGAVKFLTYENDEMRIPTDDGYYDDYINGQAALVVDFEENSNALNEFIYG